MSRTGLKAIEVSEKVTVIKNSDNITVKEPEGKLTRYSDPRITFEQKGGEVCFSRSDEADKALHGTEGANLASMIEGVTDGYVKKLTLAGIGYRAVTQSKKLTLNVGYSHLVVFGAPKGAIVKAPSAISVEIESVSKQVVGQFTAEARDVHPPEPYEGKGIRYEDEYVRREEDKTGKR